MSRRARIGAYGISAALVVAGALCAIVVGGSTGQLLTGVLMSLGFCLAVLMIFMEVGLSEERERERDARRRAREASQRERARLEAARDERRAQARASASGSSHAAGRVRALRRLPRRRG